VTSWKEMRACIAAEAESVTSWKEMRACRAARHSRALYLAGMEVVVHTA